MTPDTEQSLLKEEVPHFPGLDSKKASALRARTIEVAFSVFIIRDVGEGMGTQRGCLSEDRGFHSRGRGSRCPQRLSHLGVSARKGAWHFGCRLLSPWAS